MVCLGMETIANNNKGGKDMKVKDIPERFALVTDSQEIEAVGDHIGTILDDFGCLFVDVIEGDYAQVYGCESSVPWIGANVYEIEIAPVVRWIK